MEDYQKAIEFFTKTIEQDESFADAYYKRANNKRKVDDLEGAL
ncbi:hypothetical protein [Campylobacter subantarcticus]|nr:hypothetical protein [Campylobacter subantarcticus]